MSYRLVLHADVKSDYDEAYEWYETRQPGLGERFLDAVRKIMITIVAYPETFGQRAKKNYREARLDHFPYSIVYTIYKNQKLVFVSSVHHHKKNPRKKYRKD